MDGETEPQIIDLARLDEAGFEQLYRERIEPCFAANESDRIDAVRQFRRGRLFAIAAGLAAGLAVSLHFGDFVFGTVFGAITGAIGFAFAYQPVANVGRTLKTQYCTAIADAMGVRYRLGDFAPPAFDRFRELKLVPGHHRSSFEDHFHGAYQDASFDLYEGQLQVRQRNSKGSTTYQTVFRGQLIRMHFPRDFLGVTIVRRDAGLLNFMGGGKIDGRKLERIGLVDPKFEKAFEVWGTDQVEARYLVHPAMMERLLELESGLRGKRLRCAFEGGDLLVAVEGGNLFEPGNMFKPLADPARAQRIIDEIRGVVRVMDEVLNAQARRSNS